jgi:hypothetical protein
LANASIVSAERRVTSSRLERMVGNDAAAVEVTIP